MAKQRRPSQAELGPHEEKGDKFSAYQDSEREAQYKNMQRMSFENLQIKDVAAEDQARKEELLLQQKMQQEELMAQQKAEQDNDFPMGDEDGDDAYSRDDVSPDNQQNSSNGMKKQVDEKGENKGRYEDDEDDDDDYFS